MKCEMKRKEKKQANPAEHALPPQCQGEQQTRAVSHTLWLCVHGLESVCRPHTGPPKGGSLASPQHTHSWRLGRAGPCLSPVGRALFWLLRLAHASFRLQPQLASRFLARRTFRLSKGLPAACPAAQCLCPGLPGRTALQRGSTMLPNETCSQQVLPSGPAILCTGWGGGDSASLVLQPVVDLRGPGCSLHCKVSRTEETGLRNRLDSVLLGLHVPQCNTHCE